MNDDKHIIVTDSAEIMRLSARDKLINNWINVFWGILLYFAIVSFAECIIMTFYSGTLVISSEGESIDLPLLTIIYGLLVCGPMALGRADFFINFSRNGHAEQGRIVSGFRDYLKSVGLYVVKTLLIYWPMMIVLVCAFSYILVYATVDNVGKIIIYNHLFFVLIMIVILVAFVVSIVFVVYSELKYSMAYLIMADDRSKSIFKCLSESNELMDHHKGKLFSLMMSFIGWLIAALVPLIALVFFVSTIFPNGSHQMISLPLAITVMIGSIPFMLLTEYGYTTLVGFYEKLRAGRSGTETIEK